MYLSLLLSFCQVFERGDFISLILNILMLYLNSNIHSLNFLEIATKIRFLFNITVVNILYDLIWLFFFYIVRLLNKLIIILLQYIRIIGSSIMNQML